MRNLSRSIGSFVKTSQGVFGIEITSQGLYRVRFPGQNRSVRPGLTTLRPGLKWVESALRNYFKNPKHQPVLPLDFSGFTEFERKAYRSLLRVPAGRVITYGELANRAGYHGAARAVGTAMKKNRLPIVIPCHRVVRRDGSLGQYSAGKKWKRFLLRHEGVISMKSLS